MPQTQPPLSTSPVTSSLVRALAQYAALPLPVQRESLVAEILNAWLPDANALSAQMSQAAYQSLLPVTVFMHPAVLNEEA